MGAAILLAFPCSAQNGPIVNSVAVADDGVMNPALPTVLSVNANLQQDIQERLKLGLSANPSEFDGDLFLFGLLTLGGVNINFNNVAASRPTPQSENSKAFLKKLLRSAAVSNSTSGSGSQPNAGAQLANGNLMLATVAQSEFGSSTILSIAILTPGGAAFQAVGQYTVGPTAENVVAADFNGDGKVDLAVSNFGDVDTNAGGNISILLGNGDGTFNPGATANAGTTPVAIYAADLNGDGKLDLVAANLVANSISVMLGNGDGSFQTPVTYAVPEFPESIVAADFNGDGHPDLAVANQSGTVSVLLGKGDGTFQAAVSISEPIGSVLGSGFYIGYMDLNGDGKLDLIVTNPVSNGFSLLFGNGDGTFQAPIQYAAGANVGYFAVAPATSSEPAQLITIDAQTGDAVLTSLFSNGLAGAPQLNALPNPSNGVAAADLNGDGLPDIVSADNVISVLLRQKGAGFGAAVNYTLQSGSQAVAVAVADLNGDGKNDVVTASAFTGPSGNPEGTVDVAIGNGDGTLGNQSSYALGGYPGGLYGTTPSGLVTGDFNGDGKPDVAAGFQGGISVLVNNGGGTLRPAVNYAIGSFSVLSLVAGDFNGDGKLDLAAGVGGADFSYSTPGALAILFGKGDGTFQTPSLTQVGSPAQTPVAIAAADLNGDGKLDLVASAYNANLASIIVLLGNGDGTFRQMSQMTTTGNAIAIADLNGDGIPDLIVANSSEDVYLLGNGDGTFRSPQYFVSGSSTTAFAVADWNGTGIAGFAIAGRGTVMAVESALNPKLFAGASGANAVAQFTSAAAGVPALSPGALATAYGSDLATGQPNSPPLPWPISVQGTSVTILDSTGASTQAPLLYVSPAVVNFYIPSTIATGAATITVTSGDGTKSSGQLTLNQVAPALFTLNPTNLAAAVAICVSASGAQTAEYPYQVVNNAIVAQPLNLANCSQLILALYGTGLEQVTASGVQATIGSQSGTVLYSGPQGTWPGLDQVNVLIPPALAGSGSVPIVLSAGGSLSNTVNVTIQ